MNTHKNVCPKKIFNINNKQEKKSITKIVATKTPDLKCLIIEV